ncbi:hypothetical protein [Mesorhizobium sp. M0060]|uniref:hypothetical protein n=1 Tax=Mesorhizobium sp. M0060 TaxID=2956866 RepID=UPI00333A12B8
MTAGDTFIAGGIDLHQAVCGLDQTPLRAHPAAQRDILGQHFFCAFKRELGPIDALPGIGHLASVEFHGVHHDSPTHGGSDRSLMPDQTHHWRHVFSRARQGNKSAHIRANRPETGCSLSIKALQSVGLSLIRWLG